MSAHTPGPWTFYRHDEFGRTEFCIAQENGAPYTPNFSDVATLMVRTVAIESLRVQEANARLISAAPELLAALKMAVRQNSHDMLMTGEELRACEAAIAKAGAP